MLLKIRQQLLPNKIKTTKARQRSTKKLPENYGKKNFVPPPVSSIHPFSFFSPIQKQKEFWQNYVAKARSRTPGLQGPSKVTFINKESTCTVETIPLFLYLLPSGP